MVNNWHYLIIFVYKKQQISILALSSRILTKVNVKHFLIFLPVGGGQKLIKT